MRSFKLHEYTNTDNFIKLASDLELDATKLFYWCSFVYDRQLLWYNREILKLPREEWTDNEIFKHFKIINVCRICDATSKYIYDKVLSNDDLLLRDKIFNLVACRFINIRNMYELIFEGNLFHIDNYDMLSTYELLEKHVDKTHKQPFSNAYAVLRRRSKIASKYNKCMVFAETLIWVREQLLKGMFDDILTCDNPIAKLYMLPSVGQFLAGELIQDICWIKGSKHTTDQFCILGPGAIRESVSMFTGDLKGEDKIAVKVIKTIHQNQENVFKLYSEITGLPSYYTYMTEEITQAPGKLISLSDVESTFCELRKYNNVINWSGKKRYYKPNN